MGTLAAITGVCRLLTDAVADGGARRARELHGQQCDARALAAQHQDHRLVVVVLGALPWRGRPRACPRVSARRDLC